MPKLVLQKFSKEIPDLDLDSVKMEASWKEVIKYICKGLKDVHEQFIDLFVLHFPITDLVFAKQRAADYESHRTKLKSELEEKVETLKESLTNEPELATMKQ